MSLSDLSRLWKLEGQARRQEREQLRSTDFENLGEWTPEQKELTKGDIRKLIRERKYQVWVDRMRAKGVPLTQCSTCQELAGRNHTCMAMKWKLQRAGGIKEKALFMTQDGKGDIKLGPKTRINQEKLDKEYEQVLRVKREVDERAERVRLAVEGNKYDPESPNVDREMEAVNPGGTGQQRF
eukprot:GHVO01041992.1.p2 GENE.GHVO01041992.1~~GHVO01041992.1.p2  ORF type:complete len:182 (-),score=30.42 GHVO01041992.1:336-881(-)